MSNTYGEWLKAQREARGLTQQELADMSMTTRSYIAHIEGGRRIPSKACARRLDKALNTGDVLTSFLPEDDVAVADYFEAALHLEQQAVMIREFGLAFVPGILQTEAYARASLSVAFPPRSREECDRLVVTRLGRAKILDNPLSPVVWALLDETALRRPVGGPAVMAEQLTHIVRLAESDRVRVHVLPFSLGVHPLMQSMLTLMWFEDQPPAAYSEGLSLGKVHDGPEAVERLRGAYDLAMTDALGMKESLAFIRETAEGCRPHD